MLQPEWFNGNDELVNRYEDLCIDLLKSFRVYSYDKSSFVLSLR